jgi:hypothetical protein
VSAGLAVAINTGKTLVVEDLQVRIEEMEEVGQEIKTKEGQPVDLLAEGQFITEEAV